MKIGRFTKLKYSAVGVLFLTSIGSSRAMAQSDYAHTATSPRHELSTDQKNREGAFVKLVRESNARFQDVSVAQAEGYVLQFGCVSGSDAGAMGVHFVNGAFVGDDVLDATRPEIIVYEPKANGRMRIVAVDYLVLADVWHASHSAPPELMGQLFHLFDSPNRFGLPAFYTLHVWAWKDNPNGTFVNWNPNVSCDAFNAQTP